jgi:hypothetical protein
VGSSGITRPAADAPFWDSAATPLSMRSPSPPQGLSIPNEAVRVEVCLLLAQHLMRPSRENRMTAVLLVRPKRRAILTPNVLG